MPRWLTRNIIKSGSDNYNNYNNETGFEANCYEEAFHQEKDFLIKL